MELRYWLEKATWTTGDLATSGGLLTPEQAKEFIRVAIDASVILKEARIEDSDSHTFQVPRIALNSRLLRPGVEATRLADTDRQKPATGQVELVTKLFRAEMPVSDETLEDNVERERVADTLMAMFAEAVGRDIEEIAIKSDTARTASELAVFDQFDGLIKQLQSGLPAAQKIDATAYTTYDALFTDMVKALPSRYKSRLAEARIWAPVAHLEGYRKSLAARGTPLGDRYLAQVSDRLPFWGVDVVGVPMLAGTDTVNSANVDYGKFIFLTHPQNVIVGFHRRVQIERFRDPREGSTSFLASVRFAVALAEPEWGVLAYNVPATLN